MLLPYYLLLMYSNLKNCPTFISIHSYPTHEKWWYLCSRYDALTGVLLGIEGTSHGLGSYFLGTPLVVQKEGPADPKCFEKVSKIIKIHITYYTYISTNSFFWGATPITIRILPWHLHHYALVQLHIIAQSFQKTVFYSLNSTNDPNYKRFQNLKKSVSQ